MNYIRFFFVLYWFAPFLKVGHLPSENPRCAPDNANVSQDISNEEFEALKTLSKN